MIDSPRDGVTERDPLGRITEDWALAQADERPVSSLPDSHLVLLRRRFNRGVKRSRTSAQNLFFEDLVRRLGAEIRRRKFEAIPDAEFSAVSQSKGTT